MFQTDLLWQNDDRWARLPLGSGPHTIKEWGCLMVDLCMVVNGYGYSETPKTFNNKMKANGGFQGELINAWVVPSVFPGVQTLSYDECENIPAPIAKIDAALVKGDPVIVQVDYSPNSGVQSHWVIAYAKEGNDYLIYDPYKYSGDALGKKLTLLSRYKHQGTTLSRAITAVLFMTGVNKKRGGSVGAIVPDPKPEPKIPVPADSFKVYATTDDLAFRTSPSVGSDLIKRVPENAPFDTLEKKINAAAKLGQYGQWLHLQDAGGDQGYVAAWYLSSKKTSGTHSAGDPGTTTTPTTTGPAPPLTTGAQLHVTPTTDGLAMRAAPSLSGNLIKRLPFTARLKVLEPDEGARRKLGVFNAWIKVQDITGQQGFAAGWYLTEAAAPVLGVKSETEDDEGGSPDPTDEVIVRTRVDQLALRKSPWISGATLLLRLPLQAELVLLDEGDIDKIGKIGQWVHVRDVNGVEGYVAAWYVAR